MPQQYSTDQLDVVQHPSLGTLKFPKAMPYAERNQIIQKMEASGSTAGPQTSQPGVSLDTSQKASFLSRALSPENIARSSEPKPGSAWYDPSRVAAGGVRNIIAPVTESLRGPSGPEEAAAYAGGGQPAVVGKRALDVNVQRVKESLAGPSVPTAMGVNTGTILAALNAIPLLGPYVSGIIERAPRDPLGALTDISAGLALHGMTSGEAPAPRAKADLAFEKQVQANRIVEGRRNMVSRSVRDAEQGVKNHVGQLVRGIEGEDIRQAGANPSPTINSAHLNDAIGDVREAFGLDETNNPAFKQAVQKITNQGGQGYWSDYHNLKMGLRDLWAKAPEGSRQRAALNALSEPVEGLLKDRAQEIGQSDQYQAYNQLWSKLKTFDESGSLSDLLNLKPHDNMGFLKMINDPSHISQLRPVAKALSQYGLDPNVFDTQRDQLSGIYEGLQSGKGRALIGAVNAIQREPVWGLAGAVAGHMAAPAGHGFVGAILGASKAVKMAETARLAANIKSIGVPAETEHFPPGISKVEPAQPAPKAQTGGGKAGPPTTPTDPISSAIARGLNVDEGRSFLQDQGIKGQENITARLKEALAQNPKSTNELINALARISGRNKEIKPVSGGSPSATKDFSSLVNDAAKDMQGEGVHTHGIGSKVFISEIYDRLKPQLGNMTLDQFKQKIIESREQLNAVAADQAPLYPRSHQQMNTRSKTSGDNSVSFIEPKSSGPSGDIENFATRVNKIAQSLPDTKMPSGSTHQGKVAIAQVYDAYGRDYPDAGSLASFKERLVKAAQARKLNLSRADMPEYLEQDLRQRSAAKWGNDEVHFIVNKFK